MLADSRATDALVHDFAAQWLNLRQIEDVVVDPTKYPLYDESLLQGFQTETEMFVATNICVATAALDELLNADAHIRQ